MNPSPRQLHMFVTLADTLSFHKAAERLHITQPTLSKLVKALEDDIGVRLFERSTRHVQLTRDGQALLSVARATVRDYQDGLHAFTRIVRQRSQRVAIAALPTLAATLLPQMIQQLRQTTADAQVQVFDVISAEAVALLRSRKADLAMTATDSVPDDLRYARLFSEPLVLLHQPAQRIGLTRWEPGTLATLPLISMPHGTSTRAMAETGFLQAGLAFDPVYALRDLNTIARFVQAGCGAALLPRSAAEPFIGDGLHVTQLEGAPQREIGIFTLRDDVPSSLAAHAMRILQTLSADRRPPDQVTAPQLRCHRR